MSLALIPPEKLAMTGRIKSWLENPLKRLPVSCTVYVVEDSMEGANGIEDSWLFTSKALRSAAGVAIHLSNLRPKGTVNPDGLVASGPVSFAKIYSKINEILRRGGLFKNGAITLHLDYDHPDALDFISASRHDLPWAKRCLNVDDTFGDWVHLPEALKAIQAGDLWLVKKSYDRHGKRIYANVCLEVLLYSQATCLLSHVNLGACNLEDIVPAFVEGMTFLCELHPRTGVENSGIYLSPAEDRQVGLGVLGLANLLALEGITYADFTTALEGVLDGRHNAESRAHTLAATLVAAYDAAGEVAKKFKMERAFVVAPTATCSYNYTDREGYTTTPEIAPPIDRHIDRDSEAFGVKSYDYNPKGEIAAEVGWDTHFRLNCAWQRLLDRTGLAHSISTNWWSDLVTLDKAFIQAWLHSPLKSLYYSLQVTPSTQDKSTVFLEDDFSILGLGNGANECNLAEAAVDGSFCSSCSE